MNYEQESKFLANFEALQDTVAKQGLENAELNTRVTALETKVAALEHENTELKLGLTHLIRKEERHDAEIRELQQLSASRGTRMEILQRHLEEQARDAVEARRLKK